MHIFFNCNLQSAMSALRNRYFSIINFASSQGSKILVYDSWTHITNINKITKFCFLIILNFGRISAWVVLFFRYVDRCRIGSINIALANKDSLSALILYCLVPFSFSSYFRHHLSTDKNYHYNKKMVTHFTCYGLWFLCVYLQETHSWSSSL